VPVLSSQGLGNFNSGWRKELGWLKAIQLEIQGAREKNIRRPCVDQVHLKSISGDVIRHISKYSNMTSTDPFALCRSLFKGQWSSLYVTLLIVTFIPAAGLTNRGYIWDSRAASPLPRSIIHETWSVGARTNFEFESILQKFSQICDHYQESFLWEYYGAIV